MRRLLRSAEFRSEANYFTRYSWPAEFVARGLKEVGWSGFSVNDAVSQMVNMGQVLYEPPDVAGWEQGPGWISTGGMLARMNFAAQLATHAGDEPGQRGRSPYAKTAGRGAVVLPRPAGAVAVRRRRPTTTCGRT